MPWTLSADAPLPEAAYLIDAVASALPPQLTAPPPPWFVEDRLVWVLDLFERLARREQVGSSGT